MNIDKKIVDDLVANDVSFVTTGDHHAKHRHRCDDQHLGDAHAILSHAVADDHLIPRRAARTCGLSGRNGGAYQSVAGAVEHPDVPFPLAKGRGRVRQHPEIHLWRLWRPMIRSEILKEIAPILNPHLVVCNIGLPSQELRQLHAVDHRQRVLWLNRGSADICGDENQPHGCRTRLWL